jgi:hypothetical protein
MDHRKRVDGTIHSVVVAVVVLGVILKILGVI